MQKAVGSNRQYGLDWLRIGAFALLILYHAGMFFVPWDWHVKTANPVEWLTWPMKAINPWRLCLLFVISGVVSQVLLTKLGGAAYFARSRSSRLLIPLLAGMVIFVVPQPWFELRDKGGYSYSLLHFWLNDYFEFGGSRGTPLPTWNHLWFVAYLWVYTMVLSLFGAMSAGVRQTVQRGFDSLFAGPRLFLLPLFWLWLARAALQPQFGETHALIDDPYAHAIYGFSFFFGVGLARSSACWDAIRRNWKLALVAAGLGYGLMVYIDVSGAESDAVSFGRAGARALLGWGAIIGLLGFAQTHLHFDNGARRYLTDAIFPFYIIHQTAIIAIGASLRPLALGGATEGLLVISGTVLACLATYEIGRRVAWLRPLVGLKGSGRPQAMVAIPLSS